MIPPSFKKGIIDFLKKPIPTNLGIVPQSIPVLFFGDIEQAEYATISINPSNREFEDKLGALLETGFKRFVDRDNLEVPDIDSLSEYQAEKVYDSLCKYFDKRPYRLWFNKIDNVLNSKRISYYDKSLLHLDITPYATGKKWSELNPSEKSALIKAGEDFSMKIIEEGRIKTLFVCGTEALTYVENYIASIGMQSLEHEKHPGYYIKTGKIGNCKIIGWSRYLQGKGGVPDGFKETILKLI